MKHFFLSAVGWIFASMLVPSTEASDVIKRFGGPTGTTMDYSRTLQMPKKSLPKEHPTTRELQTTYCTAQDIEEGLILEANDPTSEYYSFYLWGPDDESPSDIQCRSSVSSCDHYVYVIEGDNNGEDIVPTILQNEPCIRCELEYSSMSSPSCDDFSCDYYTCEASGGRRTLEESFSPELRFDGVYQSPSTPGSFYYFRFYENAEVILISSASSPQLLSDWFHSNHEDVALKGTYTVTGGDSITIVVTGTAGSITYTGTIEVDGLTLDWNSAITGNGGEGQEWTFEPVTFVGAAAATPGTCSLYGLALFGDMYHVNKNSGHLTMLYNTGISEGYAGATDSSGRLLTMTRNDPTTIHIITLPSSDGGECTDTPGWTDIDGDGCDWYEDNDPFLNVCAEYGAVLGASENCCVCGGGSGDGGPVSPPSPDSCTDTPGWTDIGGDGCDWYENAYDTVCEDFGEILGAAEHCCVCGGGSGGGGSSSTPPPPTPGSCTDTPGWTDADGDGCSWYEANDEDLDACDLIGDLLGASDNCCVCGGGSSASRSSPDPPSTRQWGISNTISSGIPLDAGGVVSMAIDSQDNLFAVVGFPLELGTGPNKRDIYLVDLDGNNATLLATDVGFLQACAYDTRNDDMYCLDDSSLVKINPYTGLKTTVATVDYSFGTGSSTGYDNAMEYDPCEHKLWMAYSGLASYDLDTGVVTEVAEFDDGFLFGLFMAGDVSGVGGNSSGTPSVDGDGDDGVSITITTSRPDPTDPPATDPPVTDPPATDPPVTDPPTPDEVTVCMQKSRTEVFSIHELQDVDNGMYLCLWNTAWREIGFEYSDGVSNVREVTLQMGSEDDPLLETCTFIVDGIVCNSCDLCSESFSNFDGFEVDCSNIVSGATSSCYSPYDSIDFTLLILQE